MILLPAVSVAEDCRVVELPDRVEVICEGTKPYQTTDKTEVAVAKGLQFTEIYAGDKHDYQLKNSVLNKYLDQQRMLISSGADLSQIDLLVKRSVVLHREIKMCFSYNVIDISAGISMDSRIRECNDYKSICDISYSFILLNAAEYSSKKGNYNQAKKLYRELIVTYSGQKLFEDIVRRAQFGIDDIPSSTR